MLMTQSCPTRIGNGSSWLLRLSGKRVGRRSTDNVQKTSFRRAVQSLCCLNGGQRGLPIALSQRLPGSLAQDVGVSGHQQQRGEIRAATRALRRAAKACPADWTGDRTTKVVPHARPSTKNSISRKSSTACPSAPADRKSVV